MIGKRRNGGYAEFTKGPARNVFVLPDEISFEHGDRIAIVNATRAHRETLFPQGTLRSVVLDAAQINAALDEVARSTDHFRTVIVPGRTN